jgi:hypothetical protein
MEQVEQVLAGGDEESALAKPGKFQAILAEVGKMQAGGLQIQSNTPTPAPLAKQKGGRMTKAQKLEAQAAAAQAQVISTGSILSIQSEASILSARATVGAVEELEDALSTHLAGRILGMEAAISSKVAVLVEASGDSHRVGMGEITQRIVTERLDAFFEEMEARQAS